jgi:hypothetical protein
VEVGRDGAVQITACRDEKEDAVLNVFEPVLMRAQAPRPSDHNTPAFEVASIKPNTSGSASSGSHSSPGGLITITNEPLRQIIQGARAQWPSWREASIAMPNVG